MDTFKRGCPQCYKQFTYSFNDTYIFGSTYEDNKKVSIYWINCPNCKKSQSNSYNEHQKYKIKNNSNNIDEINIDDELIELDKITDELNKIVFTYRKK